MEDVQMETIGFWMNYGGLFIDLLIKVVLATLGLTASYFAVNFIQARDKKLSEIRENWGDVAQSIYRGLTLVGICILMGLILSSPV